MHSLKRGEYKSPNSSGDARGISCVYFAERTLAVFEEESDHLPVPPLAESFSLTIGQLFSWLTE
jgi:hypothetical protein